VSKLKSGRKGKEKKGRRALAHHIERHRHENASRDWKPKKERRAIKGKMPFSTSDSAPHKSGRKANDGAQENCERKGRVKGKGGPLGAEERGDKKKKTSNTKFTASGIEQVSQGEKIL